MAHLKIGTIVGIKGYSPAYNGMRGEVVDRDGEYYKVRVTIQDETLDLYDLYNCELGIVED